MPRSTLSLPRVLELLPGPPEIAYVEELLFASKAELERRDDTSLELSVTPDRLDLLSEGGLALHLQGALGSAHGLPRPRRGRPPSDGAPFAVDSSVVPVRPYLAGAIVRPPTRRTLDEGLLAEAVRFQELLHATLGRDRRAMSLGIYPLRRIAFPVRYSLEPVASVRFTPLHGTDEIGAADFFASDPMAARFGALGRVGDRCLTLRDAEGTVLSLPPVLNSRTAGEARVGDRGLLLESTGTREKAVRDGLGLLLVVFAARGWSIAPAAVAGPGDRRDEGTATIGTRAITVPSALVREVSGETTGPLEVAPRLARARLGARRARGGWTVTVPPWRPDLGAPVDVVEEYVLGGGLRPEEGILPPSTTIGRRRPETQFRRRIAANLLGLGFAEPHTPLLVAEPTVGRLGGPPPIPVANPVSLEFAFVRDRLLLSHLEVLARNTRHGYPQRFAEVGPVVVRAPAEEPGAATRYHAGVVAASDGAGFADAAALVDYLLRELDAGSIREPAEIPGTIPGRAARVRVAGDAVAELGEIHPRILAELGVPVPVAWAEVDLSALWPLVARRDGA